MWREHYKRIIGSHELHSSGTEEQFTRAAGHKLAEFLAKGGEIKQLEGTEIKPLPPRSTAGADNYASVMQVGALIDWCKKGSPRRSRRAAIMERTGLSKNRVSMCLRPNATNRLTKHEYARIKAVLQDIENAEIEWGIGV